MYIVVRNANKRVYKRTTNKGEVHTEGEGRTGSLQPKRVRQETLTLDYGESTDPLEVL